MFGSLYGYDSIIRHILVLHTYYLIKLLTILKSVTYWSCVTVANTTNFGSTVNCKALSNVAMYLSILLFYRGHFEQCITKLHILSSFPYSDKQRDGKTSSVYDRYFTGAHGVLCFQFLCLLRNCEIHWRHSIYCVSALRRSSIKWSRRQTQAYSIKFKI